MIKVSDLEQYKCMNLSTIDRFSGTRLIERESVADHIAECIGLAMIIYSKLSDKSIIDFEKLIYKCTVHDLGECYTGDVVRPVKYYSTEIKKTFDKLETEFIKEELGEEILKKVDNVKHDGSKEAYLCQFIDVFQAAYKILREYKIQHSSILLDSLTYSVNCLKEFESKIIENFGEYSEVHQIYLSLVFGLSAVLEKGV